MQNVLSHGIGPSLAQAGGLGSLQATGGAAAGHAVGDAVRVLMDNDIVLHGAITVGLFADVHKNSKMKRKNVVRW
jgi:hypothetical protein